LLENQRHRLKQTDHETSALASRENLRVPTTNAAEGVATAHCRWKHLFILTLDSTGIFSEEGLSPVHPRSSPDTRRYHNFALFVRLLWPQ